MKLFFGNDLIESFDQRRQVVVGDIPKDIKIHMVIPMDEVVAGSDHCHPGKVGIGSLGFFGHAVGCFTNHFHQTG